MSISPLDRAEKRRIEKTIRKTTDKDYARRLHGILMVSRGYTVKETAKNLVAARSTVNRWLSWYKSDGMTGLIRKKTGRKQVLPNEAINILLQILMHVYPKELGYLRSRWSSELFTLEIKKHLGIKVHSSTIRRRLKHLDVVYNRARPTLHIKDPQKEEKLENIQSALETCCQTVATFYSDEVDVQLNPKIGFSWQFKGQQQAIPTPGQNQKRYLAGALHSRTGKVIYVESDSKNSELFTLLLEKLVSQYRRAKKIVLIVDNYIIHKSKHTKAWLAKHPKVELIFQPVYSPWVNKIERLWKQLHETITRNHHQKTMEKLMNQVRGFMNKVSPFPGSNPGIAFDATV